MTRIVISHAAQTDVETIVVDLALKAGVTLAAHYIERFENLYRFFERFPVSGAPRRNLGRDVRIGIARPYIIFYRYDSETDAVFILRILHSKRKITRIMLGEPSSKKS
jgi:toxin ParE1/3/4